MKEDVEKSKPQNYVNKVGRLTYSIRQKNVTAV